MRSRPRPVPDVEQHQTLANPRRLGRPPESSRIRHSGALDAVIAERLRALRTSRGWRPLDLAVAAGWSHATVVAVEAGQKRLTVRDAAAICRVLGVPLQALVEGAEAEARALGLTAVEPVEGRLRA
jgi:DNA-binding XRE family transcriptional regulator